MGSGRQTLYAEEGKLRLKDQTKLWELVLLGGDDMAETYLLALPSSFCVSGPIQKGLTHCIL